MPHRCHIQNTLQTPIMITHQTIKEAQQSGQRLLNDGFRNTRIVIAAEFHLVPKIKREYTEDGVRYYETECGKTYIADTYDRLFVPVVVKKEIQRKCKGESNRFRRF